MKRPVFALSDTASEWCVLPPELAAEPGDDLDLVPAVSRLHTRFGLLKGVLGRVSLVFDASEGESLAVDVTCFTLEACLGPLAIGLRP